MKSYKSKWFPFPTNEDSKLLKQNLMKSGLKPVSEYFGINPSTNIEFLDVRDTKLHVTVEEDEENHTKKHILYVYAAPIAETLEDASGELTFNLIQKTDYYLPKLPNNPSLEALYNERYRFNIQIKEFLDGLELPNQFEIKIEAIPVLSTTTPNKLKISLLKKDDQAKVTTIILSAYPKRDLSETANYRIEYSQEDYWKEKLMVEIKDQLKEIITQELACAKQHDSSIGIEDLYNHKDIEPKLKLLKSVEKEWLEKAFLESIQRHNNKEELIELFNKLLEVTFINDYVGSYINLDRSLAKVVVASDDYSKLILTKLPMLRDRFLTRYHDRLTEAGRALYLNFYPDWDERPRSKKPAFLTDLLLQDAYLRHVLFSWDKGQSLTLIIDFKLNSLTYHRSDATPNEQLDQTIIAILKMIKDYQLLSLQDKYNQSRITEIKELCKSNKEIVSLCEEIMAHRFNDPSHEEIDLDFFVAPSPENQVKPVEKKPTGVTQQGVFSQKQRDTYLGFKPGFLIEAKGFNLY